MPKFDFDPNTDAGAVLDRIMEAYGFSSKLLLANHFEMAASSLSSRYKRAIFPADMVIKCVSETGASLEWLSTGRGKMFGDNNLSDILKLNNFKIIDGKLFHSDYLIIDKVIFSAETPIPQDPISVLDNKTFYIVDRKFSDVFDGKWLVDIEGKISIRDLTRIPIKRVKVSGVGITFDCDIKDLTVIGRVVKEIKDH